MICIQGVFFALTFRIKKVKWNLWIAPQINNWEIIDINEDGKKEILISTSAPCNGAVIRDENDCTSYLYLIDLNGNLIWKREIGGFGSRLDFGISKDKKIFVCEIMGSRESGEKRKIVCLDSKTGEIIRKKELPLVFNGFSFFDINKDGKKEILVSTTKGKIIVFNQNLQKIKEIENECSGKICKVIDLDGDGDFEILTEKGGYLYILNSNFEKIGEYFLKGFTLPAIPYYRFCKSEGKFLIPSCTKGKFLILDFEKQRKINSIPFYIIFAIIFLSISFYSGFVFGKRILGSTPLISRSENMLIDLIYEFVHEIKNSISLMKISMEKDKEKEKLQDELNKIYELSTYLTNFLKIHNKKTERVNINEIIKGIVERFKKIKDEIEWKVELDDKIPEIKANKLQIEMCIKNIIENAVEFTDKGKIYVKTELLVEPHKKFIEIEIKDTGKGMDENILKKVFDPFFTTKDDHMGLGLYISNYIVQQMGGEIKIKSKEGIGTLVVIKLPL